MKIAIVCVCYNAYEHLKHFALSLAASVANSEQTELTFVVVDNSTISQDMAVKSLISEKLPNTLWVREGNVGYFPGFKLGADRLGNLASYDFVAVCNVDLRVAPDFFSCLNRLLSTLSKQIGIVAPAIHSVGRGGDLNPKTLTRPNRFSLQKNVFIFSSTVLTRVYRWLSDFKVKKQVNACPPGTEFYSPHGSFILFTKAYFQSGASIDYPQFLFGEEDFVAEQCLMHGLKVSYQPSIQIHDEDHGSTSREKLAFINREHVKSLRYIIKTYHSR